MDSSADQLDRMAHLTDDLDDLGDLFEFGDIDLNNIPDVDPLQYGGQSPAPRSVGTPSGTPFPEQSGAPSYTGTSTLVFGRHDNVATSQPIEHSVPQHYTPQTTQVPATNAYTPESMYPPAMQQPHQSVHSHSHLQPFHFQQPQQHNYPHGHHIPLTPDSYKMHGETGHFLQQAPSLDAQQRAIMNHQYQVRKDDAIAFTPMVSPAGTPQFNVQPEYAVPGVYSFSPLTSPMLHAQNFQHPQAQSHAQGYLTNPSTAPSSNQPSPVDGSGDVDMREDGKSLPEPGLSQLRKSRRKAATPRSVGTAAKLKSASVQKSQKRKSVNMSYTDPHQGIEDISQRSIRSQPGSASLQMPVVFDSSEAESVSPEALTDALMGPPPRPGSSLTQSPALVGQQPPNIAAVGAAATPKSLLSTRSNSQSVNDRQNSTPSSGQTPNEPGGLDDLSLPEAATKQISSRPPLTQINTQAIHSSSIDQTPRLSARKTPKLGPLSTPASARPQSAQASPMIISSPLTASTPAALLRDKKDIKSGRASKKRGSISASSSKLVSPALVPKISPSIKPLLPEGTPLNSATQAMLLASKSNYQNLLEGNHLPGVTYPDSLSTGLTSKRTSHKVAEQGRRNRINEALKEMQALVPRPASTSNKPSSGGSGRKDASDDADDLGDAAADDNGPLDADSGSIEPKDADGSAKGGNNSSSSKAATVELANEYIRKMQREYAAQHADIALLRRENEELRRRLAKKGRKGSMEGDEEAGEGGKGGMNDVSTSPSSEEAGASVSAA